MFETLFLRDFSFPCNLLPNHTAFTGHLLRKHPHPPPPSEAHSRFLFRILDLGFSLVHALAPASCVSAYAFVAWPPSFLCHTVIFLWPDFSLFLLPSGFYPFQPALPLFFRRFFSSPPPLKLTFAKTLPPKATSSGLYMLFPLLRLPFTTP